MLAGRVENLQRQAESQQQYAQQRIDGLQLVAEDRRQQVERLQRQVNYSSRRDRVPPGTVPVLLPIQCAIRNAGAGWYILDDRNHEPLNVSRLVEYDDRLEIFYLYEGVKVHSISARPDEWFATAGTITAGTSVGLDRVVVRFGRFGGGALRPSEVVAEWGDFWIEGSITAFLAEDPVARWSHD